jgi:magnesium and cobalt transporter
MIQIDILYEDERWQGVKFAPLAQSAVDAVAQALAIPKGYEISILACDDPKIAILNEDFREKAGPTNVLSWPSEDRAPLVPGEEPLRLGTPDPMDAELGDIAISFDTCAHEADAQGKPFEDHVLHLLVHGTLHLLGYDHVEDADAQVMEDLERSVLAKLGKPDPYSEQGQIIRPVTFGKGTMGENSDGSSNAALGAQDPDPLQTTDDQGGNSGVLNRLTNWLVPGNSASKEEAAEDGPRLPTLGLGNLRMKRVEDVAIPRVEIVSVPHNIKLEELLDVFRESGLTRLPVFKETLDTPTGMIHLKDLALKHGFNGKSGNGKGGRFSLSRMVRPVLFVPPSMPLGVLLQKMQSERMHMALVIDEYGGVDGLVTIEDLIEQIIGDIEDEHDVDEDEMWVQEGTGRYLVKSRTSLPEFEVEIGQKLSGEEQDEEIDTLGGLVFMLAGRVPARGEVVQHPSGAEFEIIDADPRRIKKMRVILPQDGNA